MEEIVTVGNVMKAIDNAFRTYTHTNKKMSESKIAEKVEEKG